MSSIRRRANKVDGEVLRIERPDPQRRIVSVYRGSGPRLLHGDPEASFDDYLLGQAKARGAKHISSRVRSVAWEGRPVVQTAGGQFPANLLVLASGINSRAPLEPNFGYQPPKTEVMAQDEILRPPTWPVDQVSAFFREPPGMTFGAMIPKGRYLNISLLGHGFTRDTVNDFIELQGLDTALGSSPSSLCGCNPRIAVGPARRFFGHRWVSVGDAAVTRLYKDGIGSAFFTTKSAMQAVLQMGISHRAFQKVYAPVCKGVEVDNRYGRLLFRLWSMTLRNPNLLRSWRNVIRMESAQPTDQRIHTRILWGMFTGDEPYRDLFWAFLSPAALSGLVRGWRHVALMGHKPYRILGLVTAIGIFGGIFAIWRKRQTVSWGNIFLFGLALLGVWGFRFVRGTTFIVLRPYFPPARSAYPAVIPTMFLLVFGWWELIKTLGNWLKIPDWGKYTVYFIPIIFLISWSILSIMRYYAI